MERSVVILDDGRYYVELNCNYASAIAPGFLQRRCYVGVTTPEGYECIGSFDRDATGNWQASINIEYDAQKDSDCRVVATAVDRLDAVAALWATRHSAHCRHASN